MKLDDLYISDLMDKEFKDAGSFIFVHVFTMTIIFQKLINFNFNNFE